MTLDEYLYEMEITKKEFARKLGYHANYLSACTTGRRPMTKRMAYYIKIATKGAVKMKVFK